MPYDLPELDRDLSPHTGYTRAHWEAVADHWLSTALSYASPRRALFEIPGRYSGSGAESDALEGFARSFLIAAPRIVGARGADPLNLAETYAQGLVAGTEPGGAEAWLRGADCVIPVAGKAQPIVEAANIAWALHLSREYVWDRLAPAERERVADWLAHHAKLVAWPNNWLLFTAVIEAFLSTVGVDTSAYRSDGDVRTVEAWHLGDGWYTDGVRRNIDYYNAWVIHPFLWAWYDMVGDERDPDAKWRWEQRFAAYLESYPHLFGGNGSPLVQGRSLTYRTAALCPLWLGELTGRPGLTPGATRRLASGTLRYFADQGVGADGPLSLGWRAGEYLPSTQDYSGPGSPYFAGMGFLGLALPPDHPVWTEREEPQPAETGDHVVGLPGVGWLIRSTAGDGIVRVLNHGTDHIGRKTLADDPLYMKYAYSTHTAPGLAEAFDDNVDGAFALLDGGPWERGAILRHRVRGSVAGSANVPRPGASLRTVSMVSGPYELRCHLLLVPSGAGPVREGGHAVAADAGVTHGAEGTYAWAHSDGLTSGVLGLHGYDRAATFAYEGTNMLGDAQATPAVLGDHSGGLAVYVALHVLTRGRPSDVEAAARAAVDVAVDGSTVRATWHDGEPVTVDIRDFLR